MSMIFKLRMLCDEDDNFVRDYEVPYTFSLLDFHNFICEDLDYDSENMSSFFLSDKRWEKLQEFTLMDMGDDSMENSPIPMEKATLGQLLHNINDRLIYVFDSFEDRSMFLELTGAEKENKDFDYPRILFSHGDAPDQFDASASTSNKSIFEEAMDDYSDFDGDDTFEDEY